VNIRQHCFLVKRESDSHPTRKPGEPLRDAKAEAYAKLRASGVTARGAAEELELVAGRAYMNIERTQEFRERVQELRAAEEAPLKLSLDWLASQLNMNVSSAREAQQFKASTEALVRLADLYRENREHFDSKSAPEAPGGVGADPRSTDRRARLTAVPAIAKETA
jgi:hypothetical protein